MTICHAIVGAVKTPNFNSLFEITKILMKTDIKFDFSSFHTVENEHNFDNEIERCLNELLKNENYSGALKLSKVAQLQPSKIILAQVIF